MADRDAMDTLRQDLVYGVRRLHQTAGFTLMAVATLALGIGTTTAIFSVVHGVLLQPLPYPNPDRIVRLYELDAAGHKMDFADPNFEDVREGARSLDGAAEYKSGVFSVSAGGEQSRTVVGIVSADFFHVFGVRPERGRSFAPDEQRVGAPASVLVSHDFWVRRLGGNASLDALKMTVDGRAAAVVGVLPARFAFPDDAEIWAPRELFERLPSRTAHNWHVIARVGDGVGVAAARAEVSTIARRVHEAHGQDTRRSIDALASFELVDASVVPLREAMTGHVRSPLVMLLAAAASLLLIASGNVVNMLLAQAATRARELAIRTALGAPRLRLIRQLLTEALVLSLVAGAGGVLLALWGVEALRALAPSNLPRLDEVAVSRPVLLFALAVSVVVAGALGGLIAWRATAGDPQSGLAEGGRGEVALARTQRLGRLMIAGQVAATLVLLVGAGLLGRSLMRVLSIDPGFDRSQVVAIDLALPEAEGADALARRAAFLTDLTSRLRGVPGIREVGGTNALPLVTSGANGTFAELGPQDPPPAVMADVERLFKEKTRTGEAEFRVASAGYFRALRIPLRQGRVFDETDTREAPHAAVVSESLAKRQWPGQDPLGRRLEFGNMDGDLRPLTVVGVVGDVRADRLETAHRPTIYVDYRQRPAAAGRFTVVARTDADPAGAMAAARDIIRALDPTVPPRFRTFAAAVSASLGQRRFDLTLVGMFAGTALLLSMAGVYGVTAYWVARRTREIGVRMALGARGADVVRLVLGQGLAPVAIGVVLGAVIAGGLTRAIASMLFGVTPEDPLTFAAVALLVALVATLAGYLPARRATRVDPMVALRCE
jgi:predicted permease